MDKKFQYLFFTVLSILIITNSKQMCQHLGFGQSKLHGSEGFDSSKLALEVSEDFTLPNILLSDSVFIWDETYLGFFPIRKYNPNKDGNTSFPMFTSKMDTKNPSRLLGKR